LAPVDCDILIPCEPHLTFAYDTFVWLVDTFYPVLRLPVSLRQLFGNDVRVRAPRDVSVTGGFKKHNLADMKSMGRHGSPPGEKPTAVMIHHWVGEMRKLVRVGKGSN